MDVWDNPEGSARNWRLSVTNEIAGKILEKKNYENITPGGDFSSICVYRMEIVIK
jgi:hypothetical protein